MAKVDNKLKKTSLITGKTQKKEIIGFQASILQKYGS